MTKKEALAEAAREAGLYFRTWSPGDGVTRYRFFRDPEQRNSYFGPDNGIHTALGFKAALAFADSYGAGVADGYRR